MKAPRVKSATSPFTGRKKDKLGRLRCYNQGKLVPCGETGSTPRAEEKPREEAREAPKGDIKEVTMRRAKEEYEDMKDIYVSTKGGRFDENGNLRSIFFSADDWRDLFPEYTGTNAHEVHSAAGYLNKRFFQETLQSMKGKGNNTIMVLAGGAGSGKSSTKTLIDMEDYPIAIEKMMDDVNWTNRDLDEMAGHGYNIDYVYVNRTPQAAWLSGVVSRALKGKNEGDKPRTVPLAVALKANIGARQTAIELLKNRQDISIRVLDTTHGFDNLRLIEDRDEAIAYLEEEKYDYETIYQALKEETLKDYRERGIPRDIIQGLLGEEHQNEDIDL